MTPAFFPGLITTGRRRLLKNAAATVRVASRPVAFILLRRMRIKERRLNESLRPQDMWGQNSCLI